MRAFCCRSETTRHNHEKRNCGGWHDSKPLTSSRWYSVVSVPYYHLPWPASRVFISCTTAGVWDDDQCSTCQIINEKHTPMISCNSVQGINNQLSAVQVTYNPGCRKTKYMKYLYVVIPLCRSTVGCQLSMGDTITGTFWETVRLI